eukprot:m.39515 g.39515  ORF g.39515 m.39515 type:complete len:439 (+) comp5818_c0_seq1:1454-2770(+)
MSTQGSPLATASSALADGSPVGTAIEAASADTPIDALADAPAASQATVSTDEDPSGCTHVDEFRDMHLDAKLLQGIRAFQLEKPSPIQQQATVPCIKGHDVVAQAPSGTGRTTMACISILQRIDVGVCKCQALVLTPTRELAKWIQKVIVTLGQDMRSGAQRVEENVHCIVGTPSHVFEMMTRGDVDVSGVRQVVLDEADEILSHCFKDKHKDQLYGIFEMLQAREGAAEIQVIIISATMPHQVREVITRFMHDPMRVVIEPGPCEAALIAHMKHYYVNVDRPEWKLDTLADLYDTLTLHANSVVYCNTQSQAEWLVEHMHGRGERIVSLIHRGTPQEEVDGIMREFQAASTHVLITTCVNSIVTDADLDGVLIINYDLPAAHETYPSRALFGQRRGRNLGVINFVTADQVQRLREFELFYNIHIEELPMNIDDLLGP